MGGWKRAGFFVPVVQQVREFAQMAAATGGKIFPNHPLTWTKAQRDCYEVWRTYEIYKQMQVPINERPIDPITETWDRLVVWIQGYSENAMFEAKARASERNYAPVTAHSSYQAQG